MSFVTPIYKPWSVGFPKSETTAHSASTGRSLLKPRWQHAPEVMLSSSMLRSVDPPKMF